MVRTVFLVALLVALVAPASASAQCSPFLCYFDGKSGATICPNTAVYTKVVTHPVVVGPDNPDCDASWKTALVEVTVPAGCSGISVWAEYEGIPEGWTVNVGDSETNNGFGGDSGSVPEGQNAEVQVLDQTLAVYNAADVPEGVDRIAGATLALRDGALKFVVKDQFLSWGQPHTQLATPNIDELFFLPAAGGDRRIHVGFNRVVASNAAGDQNTTRNGCGVRHALIFVQ